MIDSSALRYVLRFVAAPNWGQIKSQIADIHPLTESFDLIDHP